MHMQLNRTKLMSRVFVFFVFMFSLEYALYLVTGVFLDNLIKISSLALLMGFALKPSNRINRMEVNLLLFYFLLFATTTLPSILSGDVTGGLTVIKYFFMAAILPVLLVCYRSVPKCDDIVISTFIAIGVFFSVQAIVASIGVFSGVLDGSHVIKMQRYGNMEQVSFGVWGYGNAIQSFYLFSDFHILRPQGWFIEPSKLASFLLLPAFVSIGRYRAYREKIYLLSSFAIFMAIFLTLSLAGYFAVVCTTLLLVFSKPVYGLLKRIPILKYSYAIPIFLIFFGFAYSLLNLAYLINDVDANSVSEGWFVIANLVGRDADGTSGNLMREVYKLDNYVNLILTSPFGIGFGSDSASGGLRSGNALLFWFVAGGIPAVLIIITMFTYIFLVFCHPLLISGNADFRAIGASFIGHAIQNLSYGTWVDPYFLIHLALVVMSTRKAKLYFMKRQFS